jgi:hypothetical protein
VGGSEVPASPAPECQNQADPDHGRFRPRPDAGRPRGRDAGRRSRQAAPAPPPAPAPTRRGSGLRRKARIRPMPTETGSRPIHQGNGGPVLGMCPGPAACGGTPPAGAVGAADGATAPADGPTAPAVGATAPGLGVVGTGEGLAKALLGAGVDGEGEGMPRLGADGWWLERTTSKATPRTRSTAMIAATGRMDWAAAPPRRAMPASSLSSCRSECSKAKLHSCGYSSKLQPRAFCSRVAVRCYSRDRKRLRCFQPTPRPGTFSRNLSGMANIRSILSVVVRTMGGHGRQPAPKRPDRRPCHQGPAPSSLRPAALRRRRPRPGARLQPPAPGVEAAARRLLPGAVLGDRRDEPGSSTASVPAR